MSRQYDWNHNRYVGWKETSRGHEAYETYFSAENMNFISAQITGTLKTFGYDNIIVSPNVIGGAMSSIKSAQNPKIGDIHTRYIIPQEETKDDVESMTEQVINVIVNQILGEKQQEYCNSKLSIWNTVLGDFNADGLRSHGIIKTKQNDYIKGIFMENY